MNWTATWVTVVSVVLSALLGNLWVPKDALHWFRELRKPGWMIPFQGFLVVGLIYYILIGVVLYRALDQNNMEAILLTFTVLLGNEAWNWIFFSRRSVRAGFISMIAFAIPVLALLAAVTKDPLSLVFVSIYFGWVLYDIAWTRALCSLNP
ncbi:TspO/MBR family protein [Streptomyces sp. NPDC089424]|uniref:TspO/MBR family protein n=1 Tax=Streptomyces sp. NPDC089424 TaxID=3365917 RepID=UPI00382773B8